MKPIADISSWQPPELMNYDALVEGTSGVILRACYGTSLDRHMETHYQEITSRGGLVGFYQFILSGQEIEKQVEVLEKALEGKKWSLGVWADVEITTWSKLNRKELESYLKLARESFGDELGIYTSQYMWDTSIGSPVLGKYKLWVANYQVESPNLPKKGLWEDWWLWQYTNKGRIDGVGVNLDLSYFNGNEEEFRVWIGNDSGAEKVWTLDRITRAIINLYEIHGLEWRE